MSPLLLPSLVLVLPSPTAVLSHPDLQVRSGRAPLPGGLQGQLSLPQSVARNQQVLSLPGPGLEGHVLPVRPGCSGMPGRVLWSSQQRLPRLPEGKLGSEQVHSFPEGPARSGFHLGCSGPHSTQTWATLQGSVQMQRIRGPGRSRTYLAHQH